MAIEDICNYKAISKTLASSGQPEERQFKDIAEAEFEVVINLAMPNSKNAIPEEGNIVTARKMLYVHMPVPFEAPAPEHLKSFISILEAFENKKRWVHCVVNHRASAFLYQYYRLMRNTAPEKAKEVIIDNWEPNSVWQEFMALELEDIGL